MNRIKMLMTASTMALTAALAAGAQAVAGPHPKYNVVLSDLHYAYALLDKESPNGRVDSFQGAAKSEINQVITLIQHAQGDDRQAPDSHPPVDAHLQDIDRFQKAQEVLQQAHHDIDAAEDVPQAKELKSKAVGHINAAWKAAGDAYEVSKKK